MDLRRLHYFARVADLRSMSRAAEQLHVAQPALSKSIQALEADLGVKLLERSSQGVMMTEAGLHLYEHCQIIFQQLSRAKIEVQKTGERPAGHVAIGMPYSVVEALGFTILRSVSLRWPDIRLEVIQDHSHLLPSRLRSGRLDFAIMARPRSEVGLIVSPLVVEEIFFVGPVDVERTSPVSFGEAAQHRYVLPSVGNGLRLAAEAYFRTHSLSLHVAHEVDAISLISSCVAIGIGMSILPGSCWQKPVDRQILAFRSFESACYRTIALCRAAERDPTLPAQKIMKLVHEVIRSRVAEGKWLGARLC